MALSITKLRTLTPKNHLSKLADYGRMVSEVLPTRQKIWRFCCSFNNKSQKIALDKYPTFSLAETRLWLEKYCSMDSHGISPAQKKVGRKLK